MFAVVHVASHTPHAPPTCMGGHPARGPSAGPSWLSTQKHEALAACGFAALLVAILRGSVVQGLLLGLVRRALALGG